MNRIQHACTRSPFLMNFLQFTLFMQPALGKQHLVCTFTHMRRCIFVLLFLSLSSQGFGCFILFLKDGSSVLVGNHEDWVAKDAAIRVFTPTPSRHGSVILTFVHEGWAQGGMNDQGLFFDAARTPYQDLDPRRRKRIQVLSGRPCSTGAAM